MTFRSTIFRKLLAIASLPIAVSLLVLDFYFGRYTKQRQKKSAEERLGAEAQLLAGELQDLVPSQLARCVKGAGARAQARVTVIDPQGVVLADSQPDVDSTEHHSSLPEIQDAHVHQKGTSIRHDYTLDRDVVYVAVLTP